MIEKKFVPDAHQGHWIIYVDGIEKSQVPDAELSEELELIRNELYK